jgi:two-component system OmpR family response regulator
MDVVLVRWPAERERLERLRCAGSPRLLLVGQDGPAPVTDDPLEDWIRLPANETDLQARIDGLRRRAHRSESSPPEIDDDGIVRFGDRWVALPPVEARLATALIERYGGVVSRASLTTSGWPGQEPDRNALDVHVLRLRRRLEPLGLAIRTVRSRGYLLEPIGQIAVR